MLTRRISKVMRLAVLLQDCLNHGAFRGLDLHNYRYLLKKKVELLSNRCCFVMPGTFPPSLCPDGSRQVQKPCGKVMESSSIGFVTAHYAAKASFQLEMLPDLGRW